MLKSLMQGRALNLSLKRCARFASFFFFLRQISFLTLRCTIFFVAVDDEHAHLHGFKI